MIPWVCVCILIFYCTKFSVCIVNKQRYLVNLIILTTKSSHHQVSVGARLFTPYCSHHRVPRRAEAGVPRNDIPEHSDGEVSDRSFGPEESCAGSCWRGLRMRGSVAAAARNSRPFKFSMSVAPFTSSLSILKGIKGVKNIAD
jgi:hypothetical protein